jgi:lipopolysaccharide export system protein LptC
MSYSTLVRGLTVVLPLVALALLATLFLVARTAPEDSQLPYIEDLRDRTAGAGDAMRTPFFSGSTEAGDAVTVRADLVMPDVTEPGSARAEGLRADIRFLDGSSLRVDADAGHYVADADRLHLDGNVVLRHSTGYDLFTGALVAELDSGEATSPGAVRAVGPQSTLEAGAMALRRQPDDTLELVFTNRVKLVYRPSQLPE